MTFREFLDGLGPKNRAKPISVLRAAYNRIQARQDPNPLNTRRVPAGSSPTPSAPSAPAAPPAPGGGAAESAPPAAPPLPTNPFLEESLVDIEEQIAGLPGRFNPLRLRLASNTAADLARLGLFRDVIARETKDADGNVTFRLVTGPDGRAYRQAFRRTDASHASRGTLNSSFAQHDRQASRRALDDQRQAALRGFGERQEGITAQQAAALRGLQGERRGVRGSIAEWQAAQQAPPAPPQPESVGAQPPRPAGNQDLPRTIFYASDRGLQAKLDNRFGLGTYEVRKRGPKAPRNQAYVAVRR